MQIEKQSNRIKVSLGILTLTVVSSFYSIKITLNEVEAQETVNEVATPMKVNTNLLQSIGAQLMECRIKQIRDTCKKFGVGSSICHEVSNVDRDGIFSDIKTNKYDEIEISIRVDQALTSCKGIYE